MTIFMLNIYHQKDYETLANQSNMYENIYGKYLPLKWQENMHQFKTTHMEIFIVNIYPQKDYERQSNQNTYDNIYGKYLPTKDLWNMVKSKQYAWEYLS